MTWKKFLYTGFGSGLSPVAPGTAGTVVAALIYTAEYLLFGNKCIYVNLAIIVFLLYPAIKLGDFAENELRIKDPQSVVLDEFFGYFVTVAFFPFSYKLVLIAFILFRFFDILKPFPISAIQKFKGGFGIFMDDVLAGVFANLVICLIFLLQNKIKVFIL